MTSSCLKSIGAPMISPKVVAIELPRFSGSNPEVWILQAERYFQFYSIADAYKLSLASFYLDGDALEWFRWPYRNDQFYDWKHFTEKLLLRFQKRSCCAIHSTPNTFVSACDYGPAHQMFDTSSQRAAILPKDALTEIMIGLAEISEKMKCFIDGTSTTSMLVDKLAEKSIHVDSLANDSNGNNSAIDMLEDMEAHKVGNKNSVEVVELVEESSIDPDDQVFDESSHQLENSVQEYDAAFDLVADNSRGLQMPLQVAQVKSKLTRCTEIDYPDDTQSRKSNVEEDECLENNTNILFDGSLQHNEFNLQCQFVHLKPVVIEKSVFHELLPCDFDRPTGVEGEASLIPHVDDAEIAAFFSCLFNRSSLADFGNLAMCVNMKNGLPIRYWFDTGQLLSQLISFGFQHKKCDHILSVLEFDKNGDRLAAFDTQGGGILIVGHDETFLSGDAHRKYRWCIEFVSVRQYTHSAQTRPRYSLLFSDIREVCNILGCANIFYTLAKVLDHGQYWCVNSYTSEMSEHQIVYVDCSDISSRLTRLTSSADMLVENVLFTQIARCQRTADCIMRFYEIPLRCVVCWIGWVEAYERVEICEGFFSLFASCSSTNSQLSESVQICLTGMHIINIGVTTYEFASSDLWMDIVNLVGPFKVTFTTPSYIGCSPTRPLFLSIITTLFLGHPKEEMECYLSQDVAFREHVLVGSSYRLWKIFLFYGAWFGLLGLLATKRHLGWVTWFDQFVPCKIWFGLLGVNEVAVREHSQVVSNILPSHVGILQWLHQESDKIMQTSRPLCEAAGTNVVVVAGYKTLLMELLYRTSLRRFFGHQSSVARSVENSRHVRKFFVYVQLWTFGNDAVNVRLYYSNLEDKVLIGVGGIVMNGLGPILTKQPNTILCDYVWDPG